MRLEAVVWLIYIVFISASLPLVTPSSDRINLENVSDRSRRTSTARQITYLFGISLSVEESCMSRLDTCKGALHKISHGLCDWCKDALLGLLYWRAFINDQIFLTSDGRRIIVHLVVRSDNGNYTQMVANYAELAAWNSERRGHTMLALFGPSFSDWNPAAANIAKGFGMPIFLWASDDSLVLAEPRPASGYEGMLQVLLWPTRPPKQSNSNASAARKLEGFGRRMPAFARADSTPLGRVHGNDCSMAGSGFGVFDGCLNAIPDREQAQPPPFEFDEQDSAARWSRTLGIERRTQKIQSAEWFYSGGGILRGFSLSSASLTATSDAARPCLPREYMSYPIHPRCSANSFPTFLEFEFTGAAPINLMAFPKGTSDLILLFHNGIWLSAGSQYALVQVRAGGRCIAGIVLRPGSKTDPVSDCVVGYACAKPPCAFNHTGMRLQWYYNSSRDSMVFQSSSPTTVDFYVLIQALNPGDFMGLRVIYTSIHPCPTSMAGCSPCLHYTSCPSKRPFPVCNGSHTVECNNEPDPDGFVWDFGFDNVFDINYLRTTWALNEIDQIHALGSRKLIFAYWYPWQRRCTALANYAANLNGTNVILYGVTLNTLYEDMRFLRAEAGEAFFHCGDLFSMSNLLSTAEAFGLSSTMFASDRPLGMSIGLAVKSYGANYLLEPMAMKYNTSKDCSVFGTFDRFVNGFTKQMAAWNVSDRAGDPAAPNYAAMGVAAIGVLLTTTIQAVGAAALQVATTNHQLTSILRDYIRRTTTRTFYGDTTFNFYGQRVGRGASTRQHVPVQLPIPGLNYGEAVRYQVSDIKVVESTEVLPFGYDRIIKYTRGWTQKLLEVYPCRPGCVYDVLGQICTPCEIGYFRNYRHIDCRPCGAGRYADVQGLSECRKCPSGGKCSATTVLPLPSYYAFPVQMPSVSSGISNFSSAVPQQAHGHMTLLNTLLRSTLANWNGPTCVPGHRTINETILVPCRPRFVCKGGANPCVGSNIGFLCGQCPPGETWRGLFRGMRRCNKCFPKTIVLLRTTSLLAFHFFLGHALSVSSAWAATDSGCIVCALLRSMLYYMQNLGVVLDASRLNAVMRGAVFSTFLDLLQRPLELSGMECWDSNSTSRSALTGYRQAIIILVPLSFAFIAIKHVFRGILGYVIVACSSCLQICRRRLSQTTTEAELSIVPAVLRQQKVTSSQLGDRMPLAASYEASIGKGWPYVQPDQPEIPKGSGEKTKEWSGLIGPGAAFLQMHEGFALQSHFRSYFRECLGALIILYPIVLVESKEHIACALLHHGAQEQVLLASFDIVCGSRLHKDIVGYLDVFHIVFLLAIPAIMFVVLLPSRFFYFSLEFRDVTYVLQAGYRPEVQYWDFLVLLRTGVLVQVCRSQELDTRCWSIIATLIVSVCLQLRIDPYEKTERGILHKFNLLGDLAMIVTAFVGSVCGFEWSALNIDKQVRWRIEYGHMQKALVTVVIILNLSIMAYGFIGLVFNTINRSMFAVACNNPVGLDLASRSFQSFMVRFWAGMNPVRYLSSEDNHVIDVSDLDEDERHSLFESLAGTVRACFESSCIVPVWLFENAIHEAFSRAMQSRMAKLRYLYQRHGSRPYYLLNIFGCIKLFHVAHRPPDIPCQGFAKAEDNTADGEALEEEWCSGVTINEFHVALSTVNVDLLEHHPHLYRKPRKRFSQDAHTLKTPLVWGNAAALSTFEARARAWGSIEISREGVRQPQRSMDLEDNEFLSAMMRETAELRQDNANGVKKLEKQHAKLQEEISRLRHELARKEANEPQRELSPVRHNLSREEHDKPHEDWPSSTQNLAPREVDQAREEVSHSRHTVPKREMAKPQLGFSLFKHSLGQHQGEQPTHDLSGLRHNLPGEASRDLQEGIPRLLRHTSDAHDEYLVGFEDELHHCQYQLPPGPPPMPGKRSLLKAAL